MFLGSRYEKLVEDILLQKSKKCSACGQVAKLVMRDGCHVVVCRWKACRKRLSPWSGTIFGYSKIPVAVQLAIIEAWIMGMRPLHISRFFIMKPSGLDKFFRRFFKVLVEKYYDAVGTIGGNEVVVEMDESKFGKRKYNRGHKVDGVWVYGIVGRTAQRRIILVPVENRKAETLTDVAKRHIELNEHFLEHSTVNHSFEFVNAACVHTNTIEGNWASVKALTQFRGRTSSLVGRYLARYMLRRNNSGKELETVIKLLLI